jgi:putative membrane protein
VSTLVVCIDRGGDLVGDREPPVVDREAIESLVVDVGVEDPEDSQVNCLLEGLRVARDLEDSGDEAVVAAVSGAGDAVSADRAVATQVEQLVADHDLDSAVVVADSPEDERLVPIIESRLPVDAVDRVVVRQARDIESTYYLLKQFLADEELRKTVLVPLGVTLIAFPVLWVVAKSTAVAVGAIAAVVGLFLLYKGLGIDDYVETLPGQIQEALYSGQVSLVTYVVAVGLTLVGLFAGVIGVSATSTDSAFILAMRFGFDSVPWLTGAALAASTGRLLDEVIQREGVPSAYLNLPFGAVAVGLVIRGFSAYFLELADVFPQFKVTPVTVGPLAFEGLTLMPGTRLAVFIVAGVLVSVVGVRFASYFSGTSVEEELIEESDGQQQ